ncbi:N-acetylmuramoyl-L-alanine amidase [Clostridium sardiniense]|uniref:N-acetylmuramoyl-L-alanine amidase n=1 Tax=Clostridium sardiniense TaxID=29369 RepID=UPI003D34C759
MKIAVRGGHNFSVPGARGIIDETTEDRKVKNAVIKYLKLGGADVLDVTSSDSYNTINSDLAYGVNKANNWGADLFVSCHFNKAYDHYNGAIGTEVWTYDESFQSAIRVVNKIASLGFKDRGVKHSTALYELRATSMKSMIIETCFVEATRDVELYKALGADKIGKAIAEGILNKTINAGSGGSGSQGGNTNPPSNNTNDLWENSISGNEVKKLQEELNKQFNAGLKVDGYFGDDTLRACVIVKSGAKGNLTRLIQQRLLNRGYSLSPYGADGTFGEKTTNAIKNLQKNKGISIDGIVGKNTWKALYSK